VDEYHKIYKHYEDCFEKYGDSPKGLDWPNIEGMITRYKVMTDVVKSNEPCTLLDLGCGTGKYYPYLKMHAPHIEYSGADISEKFIEHCKEAYWKTACKPTFYQIDASAPGSMLPYYDYIVMNGIFTVKRELSHETMFDFLRSMLHKTYRSANKGVAFNVMSKQVDWERDDLFHLSFDELAKCLCKEFTRNFVFRNDYGLYEYTTYIYK